MRRIAWVTDPHLDHALPEAIERFRNEIAAASPDALLVTGDIAESVRLLASLDELRGMVDGPFWFCLGNHDFYYDSIARVRDSVREWAAKRDAVYLTDGARIDLGRDWGLIGHDGWADGRTPDFVRSLVFMHDARLIADLAGKDRQTRWDLMKGLADESARALGTGLESAFERFRSVLVATHVPPFRGACWYDGRISDDHWAPHFTNVALGERLAETARRFPTRDSTVLCGHTHGSGRFVAEPNLTVITGPAEYGRPFMTRLIDLGTPSPLAEP